MAKLIVINRDFTDDGGLFERELLYILNPEKTQHGFIGSHYVYFPPDTGVLDVARQMRTVSQYFHGNEGQVLRHFVLSFDALDEYESLVTPQMANEISNRFLCLLDGYQAVYAVHENTINLHIHFIICATNFFTGMKFPDKKETYARIAGLFPAVCYYQGKNGKVMQYNCSVCYNHIENMDD